MITAFVTQRGTVDKHNQLVDSFEHNYTNFLLKYYGNINIVLIPNNIILVENILKNFKCDVLILSGGNSVSPKLTDKNMSLKDVSTTRDNIEFKLIEFAKSNHIPILAICRGMQLLNIYEKGTLSYNITNHIGLHDVMYDGIKYSVNSYHNHGIHRNELSATLTPIIVLEDDVVEAYYSIENRYLGLQWHPERENGNYKLFEILESRYIGLKR